jgi:hypothetical protein
MIPFGIKQSETIKGSLRFVDSPGQERAARFDAQFAVTDWAAMMRSGTTRLTGTFTCEGLADSAPFEGTLDIDPLRRQKLIYLFDFKANDGSTVRFEGEKRLDFLNLPKTMTTLYCRLLAGDKVIASGVMHFDVRDLPAFMASLRPFKL